MSQRFPNGSQFAVSAGMGELVPVTITNANPALFTEVDAADAIAAGSTVVIESGWGGINGRATVVGAGGSQGKSLLAVDTTDVIRYAPDIGGHGLRVASEFFGLSQITQLDKTGGEQQYFNWVYIDDPSGQQFQRPTRKSARTMTLNMDYDPELPWYQKMISLDEGQRTAVLRITLPNGDRMYYNCFVSFQADPTMVVDQNMQNVATFSPIGAVIRVPAGA